MVNSPPASQKPNALVTGGGRGIGRSICVMLGKLGWQVGINYRSDRQSANATLEMVEQEGGNGLLLQADIAQVADRERLTDEFLNWADSIELLVNNAGMAPKQRRDLLEMDESSYDEVMAANLKGPFFLTQRVAKEMMHSLTRLKNKNVVAQPMIINIGSMSAYTSSINRGEYCLSKAGMGMMTTLFADRLAAEGILVYEVRPGIIQTDMTAGVTDKYNHLIEQGLTPLPRWGQPEDVAQAVQALVEGRLPFSTGEVINVDGGFHLRRL
jgi:3-oxoacyl-[acyl-carrier protein] reductase